MKTNGSRKSTANAIKSTCDTAVLRFGAVELSGSGRVSTVRGRVDRTGAAVDTRLCSGPDEGRSWSSQEAPPW